MTVLRARLVTRGDPVGFIHQPPHDSAGRHRISVYDHKGVDIGTLVWQVCTSCRRGDINKISLTVAWQRRGLGRRLITRALRDGPGYTWSTPAQSPDAKIFFAIITLETGTPFTQRGQPCTHMNHHRRNTLPLSTNHHPQPIIEHDI
jgi:hypothetical protein